MTALTQTYRTPASTLFAAPFALFMQWNDARATRKALMGLSDHELDDIGLCRGDIERVATGR